MYTYNDILFAGFGTTLTEAIDKKLQIISEYYNMFL